MTQRKGTPENGGGQTSQIDRELDGIIEEYGTTRGALIPVLHKAQELYGYLPPAVQEKISKGLGIPLTEIYGVITFYTHFSLTPKGRFRIKVCLGTACYVKGASEILDKLKETLNIEVGKNSDDGKFSLDQCRCIGACGLAPALMVNDDVFGRLAPGQVDAILASYKDMA